MRASEPARVWGFRLFMVFSFGLGWRRRPLRLIRLGKEFMTKAAHTSTPPDNEVPDIESTGPSEFGRWLYDTRKKQGLTLEKLGEDSGVSLVQIWNLENGVSRNPQARTRKKLADALGEEPSAGIVAATEKEAEIEDVGELEDFDPHNPNDLPAKAGVYVFYDISERAIYVGQSEHITHKSAA